MFQSHFGETVTVVLAIVMGFLMSLASIAIDSLPFNYSMVFKLWAMITLVILLASAAVPYKAWSGRLMVSLKLNEGTLAYKLADNLLPTLILNTVITVMVSAANILYNEAIPAGEQMELWIKGMVHDWPITLVVSYFAAFVAEACGIWVAKKNGNELSSAQAVRK